MLSRHKQHSHSCVRLSGIDTFDGHLKPVWEVSWFLLCVQFSRDQSALQMDTVQQGDGFQSVGDFFR